MSSTDGHSTTGVRVADLRFADAESREEGIMDGWYHGPRPGGNVAGYHDIFAGMMSGRVAFEGKSPALRGAHGLGYTLGVMLKRAGM